MKRVFQLFVLIGLTVLLNRSYALYQSTTNQKQKAANSKFGGTWRGSEKCTSVGAPVAILIVSITSPTEVNLSGIYSIQGTVKGIVKGDTIFIPHQEVKDPNFTNLVIEGKLAYSDPASIAGRVEVLNNQVKDECLLSYSRK